MTARWTDTPRASSGAHVQWADEDAERVYGIIGPAWEIWYVLHGHDLTRAAWQAMPAGSTTSTCQADNPDELVTQVTEYLRRLPEHITATRDSLRECNPSYVSRVAMLTARLHALLALQAERLNTVATALKPAAD